MTADEQILPGGTAYITDLGMTGPHDGVIGMKTSIVLERFLTGLNTRFEVSDGEPQLNGLLIEVNDETGKAVRVQRIQQAM
jgi:calcineurin-like phosphoesterase